MKKKKKEKKKKVIIKIEKLKFKWDIVRYMYQYAHETIIISSNVYNKYKWKINLEEDEMGWAFQLPQFKFDYSLVFG